MPFKPLIAGVALCLSFSTIQASPVYAEEVPQSVVEAFEAALDEVDAPEAVLNDEVELPQDADEPAVLDLGGPMLEMSIPATEAAVRADDSTVLFADDDSSIAVQSVEEGMRALVYLDSPEAPERYEFQFGGDAAELKLSGDGSVTVLDSRGEHLVSVEAPWAVDANGSNVPTHFEILGTSLIQIVEHRGSGYAYGIVADPTIKTCDLRTAVCAKLSKKETQKVHEALFVSVGAAVNTVCGLVPMRNPATFAARAVCHATVSGYFWTMRGTFVKARNQKKCVELKFRIVGPPVTTAKVVSC